MSSNSISSLSIGERGIVLGITPVDNAYYRQRLLAHGVIPGAMLTIKRAAPFGGPIEILLPCGGVLVIRIKEAEIIKIRKVA